MKKESMEQFLVKCTIPEKKKGDTIYNCIWRAHRDVLTGRFYFEQYLNEKEILITTLYQQINDCSKPLDSTFLIDFLTKEFPAVEFGAIQKLVNMSLKYLLVLKTYCGLQIKINERKCDCPIDSHILNSLKINNIKWTSPDFTREEYNKVQKLISKEPDAAGGNIHYDFKHW